MAGLADDDDVQYVKTPAPLAMGGTMAETEKFEPTPTTPKPVVNKGKGKLKITPKKTDSGMGVNTGYK
jgi:hypothetical protein